MALPHHPNRLVRVAVLGDAQTGKTSLISTAANDTFDARPPPVLPPVRLPREFSPDMVPMLITDTSSRPEDSMALDQAVQQADVAVICFDARRQSTLDNIRAVWYPRVQSLKPDIPVVLACCKADLLEESQDGREIQQIRERVEQAVQDLPHVEVCLNCSARGLRMVTDVFFYALKSVLYPLQPLYDRIDKRLKPLCVRALKRVFVMCDADQDGALSDTELNSFQQICFNMALTDEELQNVKQVVLAKMPNGVVERGLTLEGFLFLHVLFIERGRLESTWAVLRRFGYNDELRLSDEVLDRVQWTLPPDQVYELSEVALDFLTRQFRLYDDDVDGLLTWQQLERMYSTVPPNIWQGDLWSELLVPGTYGAAHRLEAFLLKWKYSTLQDPRTTVAHLLYMGFGGPNGAGAQALLVKGVRRRPDKKAEMAARNTFHCYVIGPHGSGKSALVRALAPRPDSGKQGPCVAAGAVQTDGRDKVLVMSEVPEDVVAEFVTTHQIASAGQSACVLPQCAMPDIARCDVAAFLFDSSSADSFRAARRMMEAVSTAAGETLPCVLVACKDDLGMAQSLELEVATACTELQVPPPVPISVEAGELSGLMRRLVMVAMRPEGFIPCTPARKAQKQFIRRLYIYGALAATSLAGGYLLYRYYAAPSSSSSTNTASDTHAHGHSVASSSGGSSSSQASGSASSGAVGGGRGWLHSAAERALANTTSTSSVGAAPSSATGAREVTVEAVAAGAQHLGAAAQSVGDAWQATGRWFASLGPQGSSGAAGS